MQNDPKLIQIKIQNRTASLTNPTDFYIGGNDGYTVEFEFDAEWNGMPVKTALFVTQGKTYDKVFNGTTCPIPRMPGGYPCDVGVVSGDIHENAEEPELATTTPATFLTVPGISDLATMPAPPDDNIYQEIIALLNKYIEQGGGSGEGGSAVSPTVKITPIENGHRVTITDINGDHSFDVLNGEKGDKGDPYTLTEADKTEITNKVLENFVDVSEVGR